MTPERWQQIQDVFHDATSLPHEERAAFLDEACWGDPELRTSVDRMLEADENPADLFDRPPGVLAPESPEPEINHPESIGPYRLVKEIGRGGMGAVYLAERADGQFDKQVALKLVKRGMDSDEILSRFRTERQILAGLEHPHIARLLDGGVSDSTAVDPGGRPFLVMEYVDGLPIDQYCNDKQLSVENRLALFGTVCDAVHYAHQNLVVHRDLKPSNILVTETKDGIPQVKLLDFGIAKLLDESNHSAPATRTGVRVMTPEYASPEQMEGGVVTTATDVYALGVILFELLTGSRPDIRNERPTRPSTSVESPRISRQLQGDLDLIVLKSLRKEPSRRYASVEAFQEDLRRHQSDLPVTARPDTVGYRFRKFVQRHRLGVTAAVAFVILLIGFAVTTAIQQGATARERDRAALERDKAEEVAAFLEDLFNASDPFLAASGRLDTLRVREFLDRGAEKIRGELEHEPALQAQMLDVIGNVYRNLGLYDVAVPLLTQALDQRRSLYGPSHADVALTLHSLARTYQSQGDYDAAEEHFRQAVDLYRQLDDPRPMDMAASLAGLGSVLRDKNEFDEAQIVLEEAIDLQTRAEADEQSGLPTSMLELGRVYHDRGNLAPAESLYRDVLSLHRAEFGDNHPEVAGSLDNLAILLRQRGNLDVAEPLTREALEIRERILGDDHPHTVSSMYELASVLRDKGDYEPALELFGQVYELDKRVLGAEHHYVGLDLREIGLTHVRLEEYDEALVAYQAALAILQKALPADHADITEVRSGIGNAYLKNGDVKAAEPILRDVVDRRIRIQGEDSWWTGAAKSLLGECLMRQKRYSEAEPLLVEGYTTLRDGDGPTGAALRRLVEFFETTGQPESAAEYRAILNP